MSPIYGQDSDAFDELVGADSERYGVFKDARFEAFAAVARGPSGEVAVVVSLDESTAYRELPRRIRGELDPTDAWAPPL